MKGGKQAISLTEEMVYEMNRSGSTGYSGLDAAYHNYGLQGGDMESWKSDKYSQQGRYKRGSSSSSGGGTERQGRGNDRGEGPYQSGLYDRLAKIAILGFVQIYFETTNNFVLVLAGRRNGTRPTATTRPRTTLTQRHLT